MERLRRAVLPTPPEPLGFATSESQSSLAKQRAILQKQKVVDLKSVPLTPSFWEKYAEKFAETRWIPRESHQRSSDNNDDSSPDYSPKTPEMADTSDNDDGPPSGYSSTTTEMAGSEDSPPSSP